MPARQHIVIIVAFWLLITGWLFYRDLWPKWQPGEPPPYTIDLADEASEQKIHWNLLKEGEDHGYVQTWVHYHEADDTFAIAGELKFFSKGRKHQFMADQVVKSTN